MLEGIYLFVDAWNRPLSSQKGYLIVEVGSRNDKERSRAPHVRLLQLPRSELAAVLKL